MQIDLDRWQRLRAAAADAEHDGPRFVDLQAANARASRAREELARLRTTGPTGSVSRPVGRARASEEVELGIGGHDHAGVVRAYESSLRQLEADTDEAGREAKRLSDRMHECQQRRGRLQRLVEDERRWAAKEGLVLPGDGVDAPPAVTVRGPPPGTRNFWGRVAS